MMTRKLLPAALAFALALGVTVGCSRTPPTPDQATIDKAVEQMNKAAKEESERKAKNKGKNADE